MLKFPVTFTEHNVTAADHKYFIHNKLCQQRILLYDYRTTLYTTSTILVVIVFFFFLVFFLIFFLSMFVVLFFRYI